MPSRASIKLIQVKCLKTQLTCNNEAYITMNRMIFDRCKQKKKTMK